MTKPDFVMNMHLKKIEIHLHPEHMPALKHLLDTDERFPAVFDKLAELEASGENIEVCLICGMPEKECICEWMEDPEVAWDSPVLKALAENPDLDLVTCRHPECSNQYHQAEGRFTKWGANGYCSEECWEKAKKEYEESKEVKK